LSQYLFGEAVVGLVECRDPNLVAIGSEVAG
jgi:hypothetical protein